MARHSRLLFGRVTPSLFFVLLSLLLQQALSLRLTKTINTDAETTVLLPTPNVVPLIASWGYPVEVYNVTTADGFVLALLRIPHGRDNGPVTTPRPVAYFMHGLGDSCAGVTLNQPSESLSYILADAGYDVWLGNNRGTLYGLNNIHYSPNQTEFWNWSFDEMAEYDLPAIFDFIQAKTGAKTISYIGHSQGTIQAFAGFLNPALSSRVNVFIALAPVAYLKHIKSVLLQALAALDVDKIFQIFGLKEFYEPDPSLLNKLLPGFCDLYPTLCEDVIALWCGPSTDLNKTRAGFYLEYEPNPTSVKNMAHLAQEIRSGKFQKYDYGSPSANMLHYNQTTPPQYNISLLPSDLPIGLFYGGNDDLADTTDVEALISQLPSIPFVLYEPTYAHLDFLLGMDAHIKIYPDVLKLLNTYNPVNNH
eukprot:TRINITY_DN3303_c0_g1_i1.p1 TRINITY_DN3303_c0_g1~~TRINITY_DN3303_c0_g1_i1.p1  ORF type:complete len:420 (-),score=90.59 TRINITY_DN3303_c0_g1_i1:81-1340(-)